MTVAQPEGNPTLPLPEGVTEDLRAELMAKIRQLGEETVVRLPSYVDAVYITIGFTDPKDPKK